MELAVGRTLWAIPWPCLHEFLAIVTHPRIYAPPTPLAATVDQVEAWLESPSPTLRTLMQEGRIAGPQVHDTQVAALCRLHGAHELWTADWDFGRFPGLTVRNPLEFRGEACHRSAKAS
jgi:uncharacterized protein